MAPKKPRSELSLTPSKSQSPKPKKQRGAEAEVGDINNMAAPMDSSFVSEHRRNLSSALNASMTKPPEWFADYENRLETRLRGIMNPLEDISKRMETIEGKLRSVDFEIESVKADIKTLQKEKEDLITKVDDLENRSRRDNLIFFGVPEVAEKENCAELLVDLLENFVGVPDFNRNHIERCHRTPTFKPSGGPQSKPRIIHVKFSSYQTKELVRKACIQKFKESTYKGQKIFVGEDFSKRIQTLRKNQMGEFKRLQREGKKPFFIYPAVVKYRDANGRVLTLDPKDKQ